jgi:hypothetical protein
MDDLIRSLVSDPGRVPYSLDLSKDLILFVGLSETEMHDASFLDQRALTSQTWGRWVPMPDVAAGCDPHGRDDAHYIFHIGHVGSTLVSRLIGETAGALALREPQLLRDLAAVATRPPPNGSWSDSAACGMRIALSRRLLARTFRADQRAVIKATSFVSDIAPDLVSGHARAAFLFTSLPSYMATILAGHNSRRELETATATRLTRLARRLGNLPYRLDTLDEGERVALGWTTEMLALQEASDALPDGSALWLDFDAFLASPTEGLIALAAHFALPLDPEEAGRIVAGPLMSRYSKAPEYDYSTALRLQLQRHAARDHHASIRRGLEWFDRAVRHDRRLTPLAARAGYLG